MVYPLPVAASVLPLVAHHVVFRSRAGHRLFSDDTDRLVFLSLFEEAAHKHGVRIWGYCLMDDGLHFVGVPGTSAALRLVLWELNEQFALYRRGQGGRGGLPFRRAVRAVPLNARETAEALLHVDALPELTGIARGALTYRWSSARAHTAACHDKLLDPYFKPHYLHADWQGALSAHVTSSISTPALG